MSSPAIALAGGLILLVLGQLLVIGGVIMRGLFLPGVVLIGVGLAGLAAAAMLEALARTAPAA